MIGPTRFEADDPPTIHGTAQGDNGPDPRETGDTRVGSLAHVERDDALPLAPWHQHLACCRFRGHRDWVFHETRGGVCGDDSLGESSRSRRFA